ncbi:MAG: hypothetical protein ACRDSK_09495 [Actinophytocola sp.]|uniref:hypothetical protein n=1 Tax=Actinophytocola sp. TaxID=1872138 RepID=UPI003D6ABCD1
MTNDGTQDPVPPPVLSDPVAGLVTGIGYEPVPLRVRVTEPPLPDISAVREAMAAVLDEDSELDLNAMTPMVDYFGASAGETPAQAAPPAAPAPVAQVPVSQVPTQAAAEPAQAPVSSLPARVPTRGGVTRVTPPTIPAQRAVPSPRTLNVITSGERSRRIRLPAGLMRRGPKPPPGSPNHSSTGSVTLIMVLLLVMVVLGIVVLASFIDTIASVFG